MKVPLKLKIAIVFGCLLGVMTAIMAVTFWVSGLQEDYALVINLAGRQRMLSQKMTKEVLGIVREREGQGAGPDYREPLIKTMDIFGKTMHALVNGGETIGPGGKTVILPPASDPEILKILGESSRLWDEFGRNIRLIAEGAAPADSEEFRSALAFLETNNAHLLSAMNDVTEKYQNKADGAVSLLKQAQLWTFAAMLLLAIVSFWAMCRVVIKPLNYIVKNLEAVAAGDLTVNMKVENRDEFGDMAETVNKVVANLHEMAKGAQDASVNVFSSTEQISVVAEELALCGETQALSVDRTSSAIEEINASIREAASSTSKMSATAEEGASSVLEMAASIDEVAKVAEELSYNVEEVSSSISEMAASVKEITTHASHLSTYTIDTAAAVSEMNAAIKEVENNLAVSVKLAEATAGDADEGKRTVEKAMKGMRIIKETVDDALADIRMLGERSESIGNILNVINDVAEQTNLLAFNAAIIAAQAGEHGKGFAVVADEIKDLADRTAVSTKEIAALINSVQAEAASALKSVEAGGKSVMAGMELSNLTGDALEKILSSANSSRQMMEQIARASAEQLKGIHQVNEAMEKITDMLQKVYKAIEDQEKGSLYIARAAEKMKDAANQVKRATREQSKGGDLISRAIENISEMASSINRSTQEQAGASQEIVKAISEIRDITEKNAGGVKRLRGGSALLAGQTRDLENAIYRFKL